MSTRIHTNQILEHIMGLFETALKTPLSLEGIYRGNMAWLPPQNITSMVNGIWLNLSSQIDIEQVQMPKEMLFTYPIRIVYVRRLDISNNVLDSKIADTEAILDVVWDNFRLSSLSLTGGQPLWWLPRFVEMEPAEETFVSAVSADLMATAFGTDVAVRSKIS